MQPGMVFTIEPMVCENSGESKVWPDKWTFVTADDGRSAQYEHTLCITENGHEIIT